MSVLHQRMTTDESPSEEGVKMIVRHRSSKHDDAEEGDRPCDECCMHKQLQTPHRVCSFPTEWFAIHLQQTLADQRQNEDEH